MSVSGSTPGTRTMIYNKLRYIKEIPVRFLSDLD